MRRWLTQLRKEQQLTQQQIAEGAHIDRAYYAQIENGTRNPSMAVASQIASFLHINPSLFFTEHLSEPFQTALANSPITLAHCDLSLRYTWMFNPHPDFKMSHILGKRDDELDYNEGTLALMDLKKRVIETKKTQRERIYFPLSDGLLYYDVFAQPLYNQKGEIIGAATASTELPS
ncbi:transcriptional regulator [Halobacillus halophilus]|uniref:Two-component hybrid sensor and regulator n=1 Tax=Halobacillus halophilus (strain ATCC 35676 / DSM 2266 / JCM 20832 / KCTC 3685 / LMG 17431 / NBRC 102448 / NCIMB 2269) TaxID=866895 RepID=I0JSP0_HALH3|nr:helix-turn-helix domain-containing protein [Halobacillus halophilus]ASF41092.1 transcriptional regulator [Halobacillus halophilus]CCG47162.1 two-component hybrid sensor and regulator [Halobacillus halophilus DSM 2266]